MTAIEWLIEQINNGTTPVSYAIQKAKEMERQQIIEAHGVKQKTKSNPGSIVTYGYNYTGEMYYNETFKNKQ